MSTHTSAGHRAVVVWSLALTLAVGGCSAGSEVVPNAPASQPSPNASAATTPAPTTSSTATASAFQQDPVDAAFIKKLNALCNDWNSFASTHKYPGATHPQAATVEELPKVGAWLDASTMNHELVAKATGLGTPATGSAAWARVLEDFAQYEKAVASAAATAKTGSLERWQSAESSWAAARDTVREDLLKAGIGAKSSCSLPFSRPAGEAG
jgi:hypothetical protein